jgi:hypothetical protein
MTNIATITMTDPNVIIMKEDLNENEDVKARFHKMAKTVRLIRFAISVSLILAITGMIPVIIFTLTSMMPTISEATVSSYSGPAKRHRINTITVHWSEKANTRGRRCRLGRAPDHS